MFVNSKIIAQRSLTTEAEPLKVLLLKAQYLAKARLDETNSLVPLSDVEVNEIKQKIIQEAKR